MRYYNKKENKWYNDGESMTYHIDDNTLFSGVPTHEQLLEWGYEPYEEPIHVPTLEEVKEAKIGDIQNYDLSDSVNAFYVNDTPAWFDKETRSNFRGSLSDAELLGETNVSVPINGSVYTIPVQQAKLFLAQIQRYADACTIATATHIGNVQGLDSIAEVDAYDYTGGYPEKLRFTL
jgi:hypothetical protein